MATINYKICDICGKKTQVTSYARIIDYVTKTGDFYESDSTTPTELDFCPDCFEAIRDLAKERGGHVA